MAIEKAKTRQNEIAKQLDELKDYPARGSKYLATF